MTNGALFLLTGAPGFAGAGDSLGGGGHIGMLAGAHERFARSFHFPLHLSDCRGNGRRSACPGIFSFDLCLALCFLNPLRSLAQMARGLCSMALASGGQFACLFNDTPGLLSSCRKRCGQGCDFILALAGSIRGGAGFDQTGGCGSSGRADQSMRGHLLRGGGSGLLCGRSNALNGNGSGADGFDKPILFRHGLMGFPKRIAEGIHNTAHVIGRRGCFLGSRIVVPIPQGL